MKAEFIQATKSPSNSQRQRKNKDETRS